MRLRFDTSWGLGRFALTVAVAAALQLAAPASASATTSTMTRHSSFAYDGTTGLLTQETVEPSATGNTYLKTTFSYDAYGHKTSVTTSSYNNAYGPSRSSTASYDSNGEFQTSATNALNQSESWAHDAKFGQPTSHTGPNSITTTWSYDSFGRQLQATRADGNKTVVAYAYCSGVNSGTASCPTNGAFVKTVTPQNSSGVQNGPIGKSYYDALSRPIAKDVQGFDGSWIRVSTVYDANGRVEKTSRPYFVATGTAKWTVKAYDDLGRVTQVTMPDGSQATFTYSGLTTTTTNALSQTTTTVKNAQGLKATVTDPGGNVTSYTYDAEGDLTSVTDAAGNATINTYDLRGRKIASLDPDMGHWTYAYDAFGKLTSQTDAKGQTTTLSYDVLGRVTQRVEGGQTSTWAYGTSATAHNVGKLTSTSTDGGYTRTHSYDSYGRPVSETQTISGTAYIYSTSYDANGRVNTVTYPSGLTLKYVYVATYGYLSQVKDNSAGTVYWQVTSRDAQMHAISQVFGNGVTETQAFDPNTGLVQTIQAGAANSVANFAYNFDKLGNLTSRTNNGGYTTLPVTAYSEQFCYDTLNRLVNYATGATCTATGYQTVGYDVLGNITSKSGVGTYSYPATGQARPHAVAGVTGTVNGVLNPTYTYDANGNMTAGGGRSVTWTSFNMVAQITEGTTTVAFSYDSDHHRITQTIGGASPSTTTYLNGMGVQSEKYVAGGTTTWHDYIEADGHIIAEKYSGGTTAMRYFVLDHLGSIAVVMDDAGTVLERLAYDAWGQRLGLCGDGSFTTACYAGSSTTRGFTNQEEIDGVSLVNLNARIYDPVLGKFMSADPSGGSGLNRYWYVGDNPLSLTDPTGLCFLGCFWKSPIFAAVISIAIAIFVPEALGALESFGAVANMAIAGALAGGVSAGLTGGNILQGMLMGGLEAAAFAGLAPGLGSEINGALDTAKAAPFVGRMLASGLVGGVFSAAGGGNFGSGFLAAGIGSLAGNGGQFNPGRMIASAVIGGAASVLGGGKFENGAITAAFSYAATASYRSSRTPGMLASAAQCDACENGPTAEASVESVIVTGRRQSFWDLLRSFVPTNDHFTSLLGCIGICLGYTWTKDHHAYLEIGVGTPQVGVAREWTRDANSVVPGLAGNINLSAATGTLGISPSLPASGGLSLGTIDFTGGASLTDGIPLGTTQDVANFFRRVMSYEKPGAMPKGP